MELVRGNVRGTARESNLESAQSMYEGDLVEEGVPQDLVKSDPLDGIVGEHRVDEREQLFVLLLVRLLVLLERLAVFSDVFACRAVLVPHEFPSLEVLRLRAPRHRARERSKNLFHHGEMLPVVMSLEESEP